MSEIGSSLNLLEIRIGAANIAKLPSAKERRRIENLAQILHGLKKENNSSISPSSPRNFFLRKAISTVQEASPSSAGTPIPLNTPDESIREFAVDGNPNRVFLAGATLFQQHLNPSRDVGTSILTAANGRFLYTRKNILLFNDALLVCDVKENEEQANAGKGGRSKSMSKSSKSQPATSAGNGSSSNAVPTEAADGTEFGNIALDDIEEVKALSKKGALNPLLVSYIKTMKLYDAPPVLADIPAETAPTSNSAAAAIGRTSGSKDFSKDLERDSAFQRRFYRLEILYHAANRGHRAGMQHTKSLVLCSQQRSVLNAFREELRGAMISYHVQNMSPTVMQPSNASTVDVALAAATAATTASLAAVSVSGPLGYDESGRGCLPAFSSSATATSMPFIAPSAIQSCLRIGWLYEIFGGTIFEAAYKGDVRALRNHLDTMSTYHGNFHSGGGGAGAPIHALSTANMAISSPVRNKSSGSARSRSASEQSSSSHGVAPHSAINSGIGGTNLIYSNLYYIDSLDQFGMSALHWAAVNGHTVCVRLLLDFGADANVRQQRGGNTALLLASAMGHAEIVSLLLRKTDSSRKSYNTRTDMRNYAGHNAVELALFFSHIRCQRSLRELQNRHTARESIITKEKHALQGVLTALYSSGINFNEEDASGNTPLYMSVYFNLKYGVEILMELLGLGNGAGLAARSNQPRTGTGAYRGESFSALDDSNAAERVMNIGINVNAVHPVHRCTPLQLACARLATVYSAASQELNCDTLDIIRLLIGGGAYVNWKNKNALKLDSKGNDKLRPASEERSERLSSGSADLQGSREGSRRNSRDSAYSDRTKFSGLREEDLEDGSDEDDDKESYSYGYDSGHGGRGSVSSSQSASKALKRLKSSSSGRSGGSSIGAWTPLQILQRTYVEVKLEELMLRKNDSSGNSMNSATRPSQIYGFDANTFKLSTPAPSFYRAFNAAATGRAATSRSTERMPNSLLEEEAITATQLSPAAGGTARPDMTPASINAGNADSAVSIFPQAEPRGLSTVIFQTILVLLKHGARWKEKDLIEATKYVVAPMSVPVSRNSADRSGYVSPAEGGPSSGGGKDQKHHLLLTKPSLAFMVEECENDWKGRFEPANFEEFVCARQAMGDVLYQLKRHWQDDSDQNNCALCCSAFTSIGNRRHHCRSCGCLVCDRCSSKRLSLAVLPPSSSSVHGPDVNVGVTKERTCDACFNQLCQQAQDTQSSNNRYCVKQLKSAAEMLMERLQWFLQSLRGEVAPTSRSRRKSKSSRSPRLARSRSGTGSQQNTAALAAVASGTNAFGDGRGGREHRRSRGGSHYDEYSSDAEGSSDEFAGDTANSPGAHSQSRDKGRDVSKKLFTPPKAAEGTTSSRKGREHDRHAQGKDNNERGKVGQTEADEGRASTSTAGPYGGSSTKFFCPGGSGYRDEGGGPVSPVRLSLIENDVGLYKMLQHRHLVQKQLEGLLECDHLTQAFLNASRMYQAEAEAVLF